MTEQNLLDARTVPVDEQSGARLAAQGLEYRRVDAAAADFDGWLQSVARGFQDGERTDEQVAAGRTRNTERRLVAVFDPSGPQPDLAVGTVGSWVSELTVPGGALPGWAVSAVTVAQTHRRRGIARALLEGELRAAAGAGLALAMLTVSESTLYGRYGFGSAASGAILDIDTRRVRWVGPTPDGRLDFVSRAQARDVLVSLHAVARRRTPGEVSLPPGHEDRFTGTSPDAKAGTDVRCVQYTGPDGEVRGILTYTLAPHEHDNTKATAKVEALVATTDDAYAALWRYLCDLDLVSRIHAELCTVDEPVLWMIDDYRAASVRVFDHHYLRILDVPAALEARRYGLPAALVIEVDDPLGISSGRYLLTVGGEGRARVERVAEVPAGAATMRLGITELGAIYLGGVSPAVLARAGRLDADDLDLCTRVFAGTRTPRLSIWY